jgi:hypothetical protein
MNRMPYRCSRLAPRRGAVFAAALAVGAALAASGVLAAGSAQAATLPTVTVTASASSITVGGTLQSGGANVVSTVTGVKEAGVLLVLLKPGVSAAELVAAAESKLGKDPNNAGKYGSIVFDAEAAPGKKSEAQTNLQAGQYVALLTAGEGKPKAHTAFTVAAAASPATLPTPQATVRTIEFGFRGPSTLHDGELVRFENEGFLVHMDVAFHAKSRGAAKKVVKGLLTGKEKGLEKLVIGEPFGFAGPISNGAYQQETITAKPGWYVQACFMNTQDGREHTRLGMERIIHIIK